MLGYVQKGPKRAGAVGSLLVPDDLQRRLAPWIDLREVGTDGLWLWLGTVLPLLPRPADPGPASGARDRLREVARDLVDCARERARLTVMCDRYYRDNAVLAQRVRALEATLRTVRLAGGDVTDPVDTEGAGDAADRYLPR